MTLFKWALQRGWMDVIKLLHYYSKFPSDINEIQWQACGPLEFGCYDPWLPLNTACADGRVQAVEFLLQKYNNIDLNAKERPGCYAEPLLEACMLDRNGAGVDLLKLLLDYSDQRNLGIENAKFYGQNAVYVAYPDYEKMEILMARGVSVLEADNRGKVCFTSDWKACSQRFLQILNVAEKLTTLQMLNLFTEKLDFLMDTIPKVERRYHLYGHIGEDRVNSAIPPSYGDELDAEDRDRLARSRQRALLLILKTLRDENIDLRTVEHFFAPEETPWRPW